MLNENLEFQFSENLNLQLGETSEFHSTEKREPLVFKLNLSEKAQSLHKEALRRSEKYLVAESSLLEIIIKIDQEKIYEDFKEAFLTPYCIKYLKLSEPVAANFVRVARKSQEVPELKDAIDQGRITLSDAKAIASVITPENQSEWIHKAEELSKNNLEKEVAKASPKAKKPEKAKPQGENRIRVEFELTEAEMSLFRRAQGLVSQKLGKLASLAETQKILLEVFLDKQDPVRKAARQKARHRSQEHSLKKETQSFPKMQKHSFKEPAPSSSNEQEQSPSNEQTQGASREQAQSPSKKQSGPSSLNSSIKTANKQSIKTARKPLPAGVIHAVNLRDQGCCQARLPDGSICAESRWVHFHHIVPVAKGGENSADNLITLCSSHHRIWHS